jgi:UDP:flavonoid glycosyltransferase YjiC (YdhE family)
VATIVFTSAGYLGDVAVYVPVASALSGRGHEVRYVMPRSLHPLMAGEPFEVLHGGTDFGPAELQADPFHRQFLERGQKGLRAIQSGRYWMREWQLKRLPSILEAVRSACDGADLVVTHPGMAWSTRIVADAMGIPVVCAHLFPMLMIPSSEYGPAGWDGAPAGPVGRAMNRAAWFGAKQMAGVLNYDRQINNVRRAHGLAPERAHALVSGLGAARTIILLSRHFYEPPSDWAARYPLTGFTIWNGPHGQEVPVEVARYLDAGDPPVLVTLGTSASSHALRLFETLAQALDDLGLRGLFLVGHSVNMSGALQERPGVFTFAPIAEALPRCRAVVQSGSHGTNAAVLASGLPSVTIPQVVDQVWNAHRIEQLGAGVAVTGTPSLENLSSALDAVTTQGRFSESASTLAERIAEEDGVRRACEEIEAMLAS